MVVGEGSSSRYLSRDDMRRLLRQALGGRLDGQRVLAIIPDGTRTMPMPLVAELLDEELGGAVAALDYLVALGTHRPMDDGQLSALLGRPVANGRAGRSRVDNHRWDDPATFTIFGTLSAAEVAELTGGLINRDVPVGQQTAERPRGWASEVSARCLAVNFAAGPAGARPGSSPCGCRTASSATKPTPSSPCSSSGRTKP